MSKLKFAKLDKLAMLAMRKAVRKVVLEHRRLGAPLAIWKNGKVAYVNASKLKAS